MKALRQTVIAMATVAALSGCTAINVVTHSVSTDPVKVVGGTYQLDPHHWSLLFDVDHFGYSRFVVRFDKIDATLDVDADQIEKSRAHVTIDAASVSTNDAALDRIVAGPDMFDAARFPIITFESTGLTRTGKATGKLVGNLTLHGQTHPVTLAVTFNGGAPDPLTGQNTLGFSAEGHFDRSRWGLSTWWPAVGNDVHVAVQAEFVQLHN